jgi:hypothetical protein
VGTVVGGVVDNERVVSCEHITHAELLPKSTFWQPCGFLVSPYLGMGLGFDCHDRQAAAGSTRHIAM